MRHPNTKYFSLGYVKDGTSNGRGVYALFNISSNLEVMKCPSIGFNEFDTKILEGTKLWNYLFSWLKIRDSKESAIALGYGSLINHSITPNLSWMMDTSGNITFVSLRDIGKDEEFTIDYGYELRNTSTILHLPEYQGVKSTYDPLVAQEYLQEVIKHESSVLLLQDAYTKIRIAIFSNCNIDNLNYMNAIYSQLQQAMLDLNMAYVPYLNYIKSHHKR